MMIKQVMKWPISIAPYECSIIPLINKNDNSNLTQEYIQLFKRKNIDTIVDDTDENFSSKIKNLI